jgi:hypothetical protein
MIMHLKTLSACLIASLTLAPDPCTGSGVTPPDPTTKSAAFGEPARYGPFTNPAAAAACANYYLRTGQVASVAVDGFYIEIEWAKGIPPHSIVWEGYPYHPRRR